MRSPCRALRVLLLLVATLSLLPFLSSAAGPYVLEDGIAQNVLSSVNESVSLSFPILSSSYELRLTLTVFSGTPDLFVSTSPNPQISNYTWRSFDAGHSALIIRDSDPRACRLPSPCTYYVTVRDYHNPSHSHLLATQSGNASWIPISVHSAYPVTGILDPSIPYSSAVYAFQLANPGVQLSTPTPDLRFILNPIQGDAELIVSTDRLWLLDYLAPNIRAGRITAPTIRGDGDQVAWQTTGHGTNGLVLRTSNALYPTQCRTISPTLNCTFYGLVYTRMNVTTEYVLQTGYAWPGPFDPLTRNLVQHMPLLRVLEAGQAETFSISTLSSINTPYQLSISRTAIIGQTDIWIRRNACTAGPDADYASNGAYTHSSVFNLGLSSASPVPANSSWCVWVRALTNCTYSITGSLTLTSFPDRSPVRLINGLPYNDALRDGRVRWFVHYQAFDDSVFVSASRKFGDFNAWMCTQTWTVPTPVVLSRDCVLIGNIVGLGAGSGQLPAGRYLIGIEATRGYSYDVDYTLTVTAALTGSRLQTAVPLPMIIDPLPPWVTQLPINASFHELYWPFDGSLDRRNLTVTCSMFSGHVTLYGSPYSWPSSSNYTWASDRTRMDVIIIPWWQLSPGYLFFTVEADSTSTFALTASNYGNVQLQPGMPNNAYISKGEVHYYWLTLPQYLATNVSVSLVPLRGFASLFIANNSWPSPQTTTPGNPAVYTVAANHSFTSTQVAFIPHLDWCRAAVGTFDNPPRCRYVIAVVGQEDTRYQLTAVTPASTQILQASVPQPGFLGAIYRPGQAYVERRLRYQFYVPSDRCNVSLSLTALWDEDLFNTTGGQPLNLYVSRSPFNITTTADPAVWKLPRGPAWREQATLYFDWRFPVAPMKGWYYAEVEGSFGAVFTLALTINDVTLAAKEGWKAQVSNASALVVVDGQPQRHSLGVNEWDDWTLERPALFQYDLPITRHQTFLQLAAEVLEGDAIEMFARNDGQVPTRNRYDPAQWWSGSVDTISDVLIPPPLPGTKGFCDQAAGLCTYLVAVYRSSTARARNYTTFMFSVLSDGTRVELVDSVPLDGIVVGPGPNSWRYFDFRVRLAPGDRNVTLDITLDVGDSFLSSAQLFAEFGALPTTGSMRGITFDGRNSKLRIDNAQPGVWVIGVLNGDLFEKTVSLVVSVDDTVQLLDGVPLYYALSAEQADVTFRFDFFSLSGQPFFFQLSPEVGNPQLSYYANFDGTRPRRLPSGQWLAQVNSSSLTAGPFRNVLYLPPASPLWRSSTTVYVVVEQSAAQLTPFTALATATSLTQLLDGETSQERVLGPGDVVYFDYRASPQVAGDLVDVGLSKTTGAPGAYLVAYFSDANGLLPTNTSYAFRLDVPRDAQSNSSTLRVVVGANYKVAVVNVGMAYSGFTLVAASAYSVTVIPDARPVSARCESRPKLFSALVSGDQSDVVIYIRPSRFADYMYGAGVRVQVGTSPYNASDVQWTFGPVHWNESVTIRRHDDALQRCLAREVCELLVSVDCITPSSAVQYTVTTQVGLELVPVAPFDSLPIVSSAYPKYYQLFVPVVPALYIQVTPCYGDVALYLSDRIDSYPSPTSYSLLFNSPNSLPSITAGPGYIKNNTEYYLGVYPYNNTGTPAEYSMQILPFNPATAGAADLSLTHASATLAVVGQSVRWQPPTVSAAWADRPYVLRYSIFVSEDRAGDASRVLYTHCGLVRAGHLVEVDLSSELTKGSDGFYERPVSKLDSAQQYSVNIIAELFNTSNGAMQRRAEVVYSPATIQASAPDDTPDRQSTVMAEVVAAIFLPAFILAVLVALYLRRRNAQLEEELSVELPDVEQSIDSAATPADSAQRRQRRRERAAGAALGNGQRNGRPVNDTRASLLANDHLGETSL